MSISCRIRMISRDILTAAQTRTKSTWSGVLKKDRPAWSEEWRAMNLGADLVDGSFPKNLFFVQVGFGIDQHGEDDATKACIRAVRNAIENNSIPGVISHLPGGRNEMLIHVKLGVPKANDNDSPFPVDPMQVAKVFPYGKLLPVEVVSGGLSFHTGRIVEELGDSNDLGICAVACVSIGYDGDTNNNDNGDGDENDDNQSTRHTTYNTKDGY